MKKYIMDAEPKKIDFSQFWVKVRDPNNSRINFTEFDEQAFKDMFGAEVTRAFGLWKDLHGTLIVIKDKDKRARLTGEMAQYENILGEIGLDANEINDARSRTKRVIDI